MIYIKRITMTYEVLKAELEENLDKLQKLYDKWEATESDLEKYRAYMRKTLFCYRVIEWKHIQNWEVEWVEKK